MIVKRRLTWIKQIFTWKGNVLRKIWGRLLIVFLSACVVTFFDWDLKPQGTHIIEGYTAVVVLFTLSELPFTMVGFALGIFLGFRNNESYQRFWEGRRLWGQLVNLSRTFARQVLTMIVEPEQASRAAPSGGTLLEPVETTQRRLIYAMIGYVHAFRHHLRGESSLDELSHWLDPAEVEALRTQRNIPIRIVQTMSERLKREFQAGRIDAIRFAELDRTLTQAIDVQGGCERIKATPLPFTYGQLTHTLVALYCFFLPFGIVAKTGWMTPLVTLFLAYAFLGLDCIGDELEDPFGTEPNDLPLSHISRNIEINLRQSLGETDVPEPLQPVDDVIW